MTDLIEVMAQAILKRRSPWLAWEKAVAALSVLPLTSRALDLASLVLTAKEDAAAAHAALIAAGYVVVPITNPTPECNHDWGGWRTFPDGNGGEQFCKKCGFGAMAETLRNEP